MSGPQTAPPAPGAGRPPAAHAWFGGTVHPLSFAGPPRRVGRARSPAAVWALGLVTLGIYTLYWYHRVNTELRDYDDSLDVRPAVALAAVAAGWVLVVPPFVSMARTGGRIAAAQRGAGLPPRCSGLVGVLLGLLLGLGVAYYQANLNRVWERHGSPPAGTTV